MGIEDPELGKPQSRRAASRESVLLSGVVTMLATSRGAVVLDISVSGARLKDRHHPGEGKEVLLKIGDIYRLAKIIWCDEAECGVVFDEPITDEEVAEARRDDVSAALAHLTDDEKLAAQEWLSGFAR